MGIGEEEEMVPKVPQLDLDAPEWENLHSVTSKTLTYGDVVKDMGLGAEEVFIPKDLEQNGLPNWILEMDVSSDAIYKPEKNSKM